MLKWFDNLTDANKVAIVVPVIVAVIGGLFRLFKLLGKKKSSNTIHQKGSDHLAVITDGNGHMTNIAKRDIHTGMDPEAALGTLVDKNIDTATKLGRSEKENEQYRETIRRLEEQLAKQPVLADPGRQQTPQPTQEAKELAKLITQNDAPYAQALKAIAEGNNKQADSLLDQTQQILDDFQEKKDEVQAKIYLARMQNASYADRPLDALKWCDKLKPLAGKDPLILHNMAVVYFNNANYKEAEPLMKRALKIDEKSFGPNHPNVAIRLNNLAILYQDTNRPKEAEPLMKRHLEIFLQFTRRTGHQHPHLKSAITNYSNLLMEMGYSKAQVAARLKEMSPEFFE